MKLNSLHAYIIAHLVVEDKNSREHISEKVRRKRLSALTFTDLQELNFSATTTGTHVADFGPVNWGFNKKNTAGVDPQSFIKRYEGQDGWPGTWQWLGFSGEEANTVCQVLFGVGNDVAAINSDTPFTPNTQLAVNDIVGRLIEMEGNREILKTIYGCTDELIRLGLGHFLVNSEIAGNPGQLTKNKRELLFCGFTEADFVAAIAQAIKLIDMRVAEPQRAVAKSALNVKLQWSGFYGFAPERTVVSIANGTSHEDEQDCERQKTPEPKVVFERVSCESFAVVRKSLLSEQLLKAIQKDSTKEGDSAQLVVAKAKRQEPSEKKLGDFAFPNFPHTAVSILSSAKGVQLIYCDMKMYADDAASRINIFDERTQFFAPLSFPAEIDEWRARYNYIYILEKGIDKPHCHLEPSVVLAFQSNGYVRIAIGWNAVSRDIYIFNVIKLDVLQSMIESYASSKSGKINRDQYAKLSAELVEKLTGHIDPVSTLALSPDGHLISGAGKEIKIWDLTSGKCVQTLYSPCDFNHLLPLSDQRLVSYSTPPTAEPPTPETSKPESHICIWNIKGKVAVDIKFGKNTFYAVACVSNRLLLREQNAIVVLDTDNGAIIKRLLVGANKSENGYNDVLPLSNGYVMIQFNYEVQIWDIDRGECVRTINVGTAEQLELLPDDRLLSFSIHRDYCNGREGVSVRVWENCAKDLQPLPLLVAPLCLQRQQPDDAADVACCSGRGAATLPPPLQPIVLRFDMGFFGNSEEGEEGMSTVPGIRFG